MKKFLFTKRHFDLAVSKFEDTEHQKWIKTYFPFKESELEIPPRNSISFCSRSWANPIWDPYMEVCNSVFKKASSDPWRIFFTKFVGGPDLKFLDKVVEVIIEEGFFFEPIIRKNPSVKKTPKIISKPQKTISDIPSDAIDSSNSDMGWVYLIKNKDLHKIGLTVNMYDRMRRLDADETIFAVKCLNYRSLEKELHSFYKAVRVPGCEWFRLSAAQVEEAQKLMHDKKII